MCRSVRSVGAVQSPPTDGLQPIGSLVAVRPSQLPRRRGRRVEGQQAQQRIERLVAAVQAEELIGQQDADAGGAVVTAVTQREEDVRVAAVPA